MNLNINESNIDSFNIDIIIDNCYVDNYFWHVNNTIFDVEFKYDDSFIVMVSFSKNNLGNWWEQRSPFWDNFLINLYEYDKNKDYYNKLFNIKKVIKNKILSKAFLVYEENKNVGTFNN